VKLLWPALVYWGLGGLNSGETPPGFQRRAAEKNSVSSLRKMKGEDEGPKKKSASPQVGIGVYHAKGEHRSPG